ncbi:hypothetical protein UFOVP1375_38 [uncultured Caudovirales phage]|uniref:Uncharacterized protein n=1 Tax=uncultured Caudovirales phage TaxID=2100421 RepID=A0A6J5QH58_9CAUD|nr:hypothetical protein UFOVP1107_13 [uncultured Caudovirales phage]CAB4187900.1 hypothetical protein UFOVP1171_23 [uncultured Caudovirales phage]CAB4202834.1 hypothetical protein UFOVP1375_38 [uncultured Caudovirales phage]CAB4214775.1 hypothetical protein UFOVP1471_8 [uncultured Caudovirales phage]
MKHTYNAATDQDWEIVYTMSRRYPATMTDPAEGGEIEIEAVWLMALSPEGKRIPILDIQPHLRGEADLKAIFGKYVYETLAEHAADEIADERAAAAEYRADMRRE